MTSSVLKLKVKSIRAYREFNEVAPFTQFNDLVGLIDIVALEECEELLAEMRDIHKQQCNLTCEDILEYERKFLNRCKRR